MAPPIKIPGSPFRPAPSLDLILRGGVSLDQRADWLRSLNFFDGKFLRASDFQLEQRFHRRSVGLSNRAGGWGVAEGFCLRLASSGTELTVDPGLAIDPEGWVLFLTATARVKISEVLRTPTAESAASPTYTLGTGLFAECENRAAAPRAEPPAGSRGYWILRITQDEALCGEEDVYGRICEDACITDIARPYRDEGVRIFAERVSLDLPAPRTIPMSDLHHRSRVASAYFRTETPDPGHLISAAGLRSNAWCCGADPKAVRGVPLGLLAWDGSRAQFLDVWTARRDRMEVPPRRSWGLRMRMRPWDVFLAQVLQFQCQLAGLLGADPGARPGDPGEDPCRRSKETLGAAETYLQRIRESYSRFLSEFPDARFDFPDGLSALDELTQRMRREAVTEAPTRSERILLDGGVIELPPAGYLPIDLQGGSVNKQVQELLGPGVDLRFAIVTPDYVAHALEEAQHMERISLWQGIDDPNNKPKVDILVPGGELRASEGVVLGRAYATNFALSMRDGGRTGSVGATRAELNSAGGGTFYFAGGLSNTNPTPTPPSPVEPSPGGPVAPGISPASPHPLGSSELLDTLVRYARMSGASTARRRAELLSGGSLEDSADERVARVVDALMPVRPIKVPATGGLWLEGQVTGNPVMLDPEGSVHFSAEANVGLPRSKDPVQRAVISGDFKALRVQSGIAGWTRMVSGRVPVLQITTRGARDQPEQLGLSLEVVLAWRADQQRLRIIALEAKNQIQIHAEVTAGGSPQALGIRVAVLDKDSTPLGSLALNIKAGAGFGLDELPGPEAKPAMLGDAHLLESATALAEGSDSRKLADAAIDLLDRLLVEVETDLDFGAYARRRLYGADASKPPTAVVVPHLDWVLFHKRREWAEAAVLDAPAPLQPRRYQVFHAPAEQLQNIELMALLKAATSTDPAVRQRAFAELAAVRKLSAPVGFVDFEPRGERLLNPGAFALDLAAARPGNVLELAVIATRGDEDGAALEASRLDRLEGALPQGLDASRAEELVLPDEIPSFVTAAAEGSILLVTRRREVVTNGVHLIYAAAAGFTLTLVSAGSSIISVIKVVREITGLALAEARALVDKAPVVIAQQLPEADAKRFATALEQAGATVRLDRGTADIVTLAMQGNVQGFLSASTRIARAVFRAGTTDLVDFQQDSPLGERTFYLVLPNLPFPLSADTSQRLSRQTQQVDLKLGANGSMPVRIGAVSASLHNFEAIEPGLEALTIVERTEAPTPVPNLGVFRLVAPGAVPQTLGAPMSLRAASDAGSPEMVQLKKSLGPGLLEHAFYFDQGPAAESELRREDIEKAVVMLKIASVLRKSDDPAGPAFGIDTARAFGGVDPGVSWVVVLSRT